MSLGVRQATQSTVVLRPSFRGRISPWPGLARRGTDPRWPLLCTSNPIHKHMKLSVTTLVTILALGSGVATLATGCAGTPTKESTGEFIDDATITTKVK